MANKSQVPCTKYRDIVNWNILFIYLSFMVTTPSLLKLLSPTILPSLSTRPELNWSGRVTGRSLLILNILAINNKWMFTCFYRFRYCNSNLHEFYTVCNCVVFPSISFLKIPNFHPNENSSKFFCVLLGDFACIILMKIGGPLSQY